jgi:hypothetical protein
VNCKLKLKKKNMLKHFILVNLWKIVNVSLYFKLIELGHTVFSGGGNGLWKNFNLNVFFVVGKKKLNWIGIAVLIGNWVGKQFF